MPQKNEEVFDINHLTRACLSLTQEFPTTL